eukprot:m.265094 g.265094  ORF g.265094 m.265094 type:complete len:785 (-) comp15626_c2_seq2:147-2501(-)
MSGVGAVSASAVAEVGHAEIEATEHANGSEHAGEAKELSDYTTYFETDFDPGRFATTIITSGLVTDQLDKVRAGITRVQQQLREQVSSHHEDLLTQATGIQRLEDVLGMVTGQVDTLTKGIDSLKQKITVPYNNIAKQTRLLARMQEARELLRRARHYRALSNKLRQQTKEDGFELKKAAQTLHQLETFVDDPALKGIEIVERERSWVYEVRKRVVTEARDVIRTGVTQKNPSTIATALQVFHNLSTLSAEVHSVLEEQLDIVNNRFDSSLSLPSGESSQMQLSTLQNTIWANLESMLALLRQQLARIRALHHALAKQRSQLHHVTYLQLVQPTEGGVVRLFWQRAMEALEARMSQIRDADNLLRKVFEVNYPRLAQSAQEMWRRLPSPPGDYSAELLQDDERLLMNALVPCQQIYLTSSLARLFDPVNLMFEQSSTKIPTEHEISSFARAVLDEVAVGRGVESFQTSLLQNAQKALSWFSTQIETLCVNDLGSLKIAGGASNLPVARAVKLVNRVNQLRFEVSQGLAAQASVPEPLVKAFTALETLSSTFLGALFAAIRRDLFNDIIDIHGFDFLNEPVHDDSPYSSYMSVLEEDFHVVQETVLKPLAFPSVAMEYVTALLDDLMQYYVINICIMDTVSQDVKMKLVPDLTQFEVLLESLAMASGKQLKQIEPAYTQLRSTRNVFFMNLTNLSTADVAWSPSLLLHYTFTQVSDVMDSPRLCEGSTHSEYANWYLEASEEDRLAACALALKRYSQKASASSVGEYHTLYPSMLALSKKTVHET